MNLDKLSLQALVSNFVEAATWTEQEKRDAIEETEANLEGYQTAQGDKAYE